MNYTEIEMYECKDCEEVHYHSDDAQACCGYARYACPKCKWVYDDEEDAINCCENFIVIEKYQCDSCNDIHDTESDAEECCAEEEESDE